MVVEVDTAIGIACKLAYINLEQLKPSGNNIVTTFRLLSGMIER